MSDVRELKKNIACLSPKKCQQGIVPLQMSMNSKDIQALHIFCGKSDLNIQKPEHLRLRNLWEPGWDRHLESQGHEDEHGHVFVNIIILPFVFPKGEFAEPSFLMINTLIVSLHLFRSLL